jgi:hypothetical protein
MTFLLLFMDKFITRLKYYGIGFGLGLVFVFFFFQNRGCSWLPANRVKNSILDRVLSISDTENAILKQKGIHSKEIINLLNDGKVDFKKSKKDGNLKIYHLSNDKIQLYFLLPKEAFVSEIKIAKHPVSKIKPSETGQGRLIRFPNDKNLVFVDTTELLTCKIAKLGYIDQRLILKDLKKNGTIDFKKSNLYANPKPIVDLEFYNAKKEKVNAKAIWYKNKINIFSINSSADSLCKN